MANLSEWLRDIKVNFTRYYNRRHHRRGYFRGERFKSVIVDRGETLVNCLAYIDLNPLRAGLVKRLEEYRWNSIGYHIQTENKDGFLSTDFGLKEFNVPGEKERARMVNPRKMYVIDTGLMNACSRNLRPEWGHLLENFVFMELRRRYKIIEYYKTASGREVDFIVAGGPSARPSLIQAAAEMDKASTRSRELKALDEAMKESGISEAIIVTLNHEEYLDTPGGHIHILPAWRWVLYSV